MPAKPKYDWQEITQRRNAGEAWWHIAKSYGTTAKLLQQGAANRRFTGRLAPKTWTKIGPSPKLDPAQPAADERLVDWLQSAMQPFVYAAAYRPSGGSEFPELLIDVPEEWESVQLAPLYDTHIGAHQHDAELFARHLAWLAETPNVLTWGGGDLIENASKLSVGAGVYEQDFSPDNQLVQAATQLASVRHKMLFTLPGNHEERSRIVGISLGQWLSWLLGVPYFPDFAMCTLRWRGNSFRILAHHGTGAAATPGGQRNAARKDLAWVHKADLIWTGHLHNALVDVVFQTDIDQGTGRVFERNALVVISPSYLKYFSSYAATKRYPPGTRGLAVVELQADGRIDAALHARGRRL